MAACTMLNNLIAHHAHGKWARRIAGAVGNVLRKSRLLGELLTHAGPVELLFLLLLVASIATQVERNQLAEKVGAVASQDGILSKMTIA